MLKIIRLAKIVNTLVLAGRPLRSAVHDVVNSYGLTRLEAVQLIRLVR